MFRHAAALFGLACLLSAPCIADERVGDPFAETYAALRAEAADAMWRTDAARAELALTPEGVTVPLTSDAPVLTGAAEFAAAAAAASADLRRADGPSDLVCIFAGMAEDAHARAGAIEGAANAAARDDALAELRALLDDALAITPAPNESGADPFGSAPPMSCPAARVDVSVAPYEYLTVQP